MTPRDDLAARVAAAQALAAAATPGPWIIDERVRCAAIVAPGEVDSPGLGRDYSGVLAFWMPSQRWHYQHEDKPLTVWDPPRGNMGLMAAAPDLAALVTDLWNAYLTACDKADGRDRSEANVRRLTRELDEARGRIDSAFCMLAEGPDAIGGLEAREQAIKILRGDK